VSSPVSAGRAARVAALPILLAACLGAAAPHHHDRGPGAEVLAPGYFDLEFAAPEPGTYALPVVRRAADGAVLDESGRERRLWDVFGDRVVVLAFIYTTCSDVNGCPLASYVLQRVQERALADPALRDELRLVSVSFDPAHDTPAVMAEYGMRLRRDEFDWQFVTTASEAALAPLLDAYDQFVIRDASGSISHVLRVMLIDREHRVRNIYSVSYLHADTVLSDVRTVLRERQDALNKSRVLP
jgi:cytochrome oxidase Cu insertion factor (SCO1/SenC/PrrC family)